MRRGQLISADAVIAVAALALVAAIVLNAFQVALHEVERQQELASQAAQGAAAKFAENTTGVLPKHCVIMSNGTNTCAGFSCAKNVFTAGRFAACDANASFSNLTYCYVEVKTCE